MRPRISTEPALCFDDVLIVPADTTTAESRNAVDLTTSIQTIDGNQQIDLRYPLMASPMDTVVNSEMAIKLGELGVISYLPRYNTISEQTQMWKNSQGDFNHYLVGCAVGISDEEIGRIDSLYQAGCRNFCVDIANGHMQRLYLFLAEMVKTYPDCIIISGNVATAIGYKNLSHLSGVRVGIGGGAGCTTRIQTGVGLPLMESVIQAREAKEDSKALIIADGGIKNSGDAAKALIFSDLIMLGSLLAACKEAPGEVVLKDGIQYKTYRGMASREAQNTRPGAPKIITPEGAAGLVKLNGEVDNFILEFFGGIKSSLTYSNATNLTDFRSKASLQVVTSNTIKESHPRVS